MNLKTVSPAFPEIDSTVVQVAAEPVTVEYDLNSTPVLSEAATARLALLATEARRYDPELIKAQYRNSFWQVFGRILSITLPCLSFAFGLWWDRAWGRSQKNQRRRAIQLREILTNLGPAYIKVGQALSTRPDLVPPIFLEELAILQDQLPPFPNEVAYQFIEEELGDRPEAIYAELSPQPVAAASLGQVYKGKLKTGEVVAVKVQRPGLARLVTLDIYILRRLAQWAQNNIKIVRSDLVAIMDEFGARIFEEMDYTQEGRNSERFAKLYGYLPDIYVPRIYWEYTGRRVLTMEWIYGIKLTNMEAIKEQGIDARHLIDVGVQCSLRQLLEFGFFHADPHPGNLLATPEGKLAYIDFGMMSEVKPEQRYGLIEAVVHLVNRDFTGLANDYVKLEFLTEDTDLTPIIPALADVFNDALGATVAEINIKVITDKLSSLMYDYPFRVPAFFALIIRSLVTLEGIAINVDPDFKVLSRAYPYVAKRLLTDPAPQLRTSLKNLLFKDGNFRWNRLENLLKNAGSGQDYDLNEVLNQTLEFLFSERGDFIREQLVEEIVKAVDGYGRQTLDNVSYSLRERIGLVDKKTSVRIEEAQSADHIKRIWELLKDTPGFDPMQLVPIIPQLLLKPETQRMGQKIAGGLAQRVMARMIREALLKDAPQDISQNGRKTASAPKMILPSAAVIR